MTQNLGFQGFKKSTLRPGLAYIVLREALPVTLKNINIIAQNILRSTITRHLPKKWNNF